MHVATEFQDTNRCTLRKKDGLKEKGGIAGGPRTSGGDARMTLRNKTAETRAGDVQGGRERGGDGTSTRGGDGKRIGGTNTGGTNTSAHVAKR